MMTPTNVFFMVAIPVALMGIIGLVLLSGSLKSDQRRTLERALIVVFYPVLPVFFGWRTAQSAMEAQWLMAALSLFLCVAIGFQGVTLFRKRQRIDGTRT